MNQSTQAQGGSPTFTIKVETKSPTKVIASVPSMGISAEGATRQQAIHIVKAKVDTAIQSGKIKQIA